MLSSPTFYGWLLSNTAEQETRLQSRRELETSLPELMSIIRQDGMIWLSWPKKASKVATDVTEDVIRKELRKSTGKR